MRPAQTVEPEAKTLSKLIHRSRTGDGGSEQAGRSIKAYARKHGTTEAALVAAVNVASPPLATSLSMRNTVDSYRFSHEVKDGQQGMDGQMLGKVACTVAPNRT